METDISVGSGEGSVNNQTESIIIITIMFN